MGGKGSGDTSIEYPDFLVNNATQLMNYGWSQIYTLLRTGATTPYTNLYTTNPDTIFFASGKALSDYPSVFDMFEDLMHGINIDSLYGEDVGASYGPINDAIAAQSALLEEDLNSNAYPRFEAGMTDMNAASSTGFFTGRARMETDKSRTLSDYAAKLKMYALQLGQTKWMKRMEWNTQVVSHYVAIVHQYLGEDTQFLSTSSQLNTAQYLWPFTLLDHQRALVGVLNGAAAAQVKKDSGFARVLSGAIGLASVLSAPLTGGASLGGMLFRAAGAAAGAIAGNTAQSQAVGLLNVPQISYNPADMPGGGS